MAHPRRSNSINARLHHKSSAAWSSYDSAPPLSYLSEDDLPSPNRARLLTVSTLWHTYDAVEDVLLSNASATPQDMPALTAHALLQHHARNAENAFENIISQLENFEFNPKLLGEKGIATPLHHLRLGLVACVAEEKDDRVEVARERGESNDYVLYGKTTTAFLPDVEEEARKCKANEKKSVKREPQALPSRATGRAAAKVVRQDANNLKRRKSITIAKVEGMDDHMLKKQQEKEDKPKNLSEILKRMKQMDTGHRIGLTKGNDHCDANVLQARKRREAADKRRRMEEERKRREAAQEKKEQEKRRQYVEKNRKRLHKKNKQLGRESNNEKEGVIEEVQEQHPEQDHEQQRKQQHGEDQRRESLGNGSNAQHHPDRRGQYSQDRVERRRNDSPWKRQRMEPHGAPSSHNPGPFHEQRNNRRGAPPGMQAHPQDYGAPPRHSAGHNPSARMNPGPGARNFNAGMPPPGPGFPRNMPPPPFNHGMGPPNFGRGMPAAAQGHAGGMAPPGGFGAGMSPAPFGRGGIPPPMHFGRGMPPHSFNGGRPRPGFAGRGTRAGPYGGVHPDELLREMHREIGVLLNSAAVQDRNIIEDFIRGEDYMFGPKQTMRDVLLRRERTHDIMLRLIRLNRSWKVVDVTRI